LRPTRFSRVQSSPKSGSGPGGRRFKSSLPDQFKKSHLRGFTPVRNISGVCSWDNARCNCFPLLQKCKNGRKEKNKSSGPDQRNQDSELHFISLPQNVLQRAQEIEYLLLLCVTQAVEHPDRTASFAWVDDGAGCNAMICDCIYQVGSPAIVHEEQALPQSP
jgi:hypothetical protein